MIRYNNTFVVAALPTPFIRFDALGPSRNNVIMAGNGITVQQVDVGSGRFLNAAGVDETLVTVPELNNAQVLRFGRAGHLELNVDTPASLLDNNNRSVYVVARVNAPGAKREICGYGKDGTLGAFDLVTTDLSKFGYHRIGETIEGQINMDQNQWRIYAARYWNNQNPSAQTELRGQIQMSDGIRSLAETAPAFITGNTPTGSSRRFRLGVGAFGQFVEGTVEVAHLQVISDFITNEEHRLICAELRNQYGNILP